jgi:hypothetical protein
MKNLFGLYCSATTFRHDEEMRESHAKHLSQVLEKQPQLTHSTQQSSSSLIRSASSGRVDTTIIVRKTNPPVMAIDHVATPPEILATSPGSESQSLRRKAVLEGLMEERVKRARLQLNHNESSPRTVNQLPNHGLQQSPAGSRQNIESTLLGIQSANDRGPPPQGDSLMVDEDDEEGRNLDAYWDPTDEVYRCGSCGYELWISKGECIECSTEEQQTYFEVLDPDLGLRPGIGRVDGDTDGNIDFDEKIELLGDCIDLDSSAYDSQDERDEHNDVYEINSFIDDESIPNHQDEGSDSSSDEDTDYEQKFYELQIDYFNLADEYDETLNEYDELRRDVLGSDYYDSIYGSDDLEFNEAGIVMVNIAPPDPLLTEVILSQSEQDSRSQEPGTPDSALDGPIAVTIDGESQKSEALAEEANARAEAYEIALGGRWHDVSLVSTGGNHSYEEDEL